MAELSTFPLRSGDTRPGPEPGPDVSSGVIELGGGGGECHEGQIESGPINFERRRVATAVDDRLFPGRAPGRRLRACREPVQASQSVSLATDRGAERDRRLPGATGAPGYRRERPLRERRRS